MLRLLGRVVPPTLPIVLVWAEQAQSAVQRLYDSYPKLQENHITQRAALIGTGRASDIIVNILLPIVLVWAEQTQSSKLTDAVQRLYDSYPKLQENHITQRIEAQIFSQEQPIKLISPSAKKQQGAIYLHRNFCSSQLCDLCPVIEGGGIVKEQCTSI